MKYKHYLCKVVETLDNENRNITGEEFLVMAFDMNEVKQFLDREFQGYKVKIYNTPLTDAEAEMSGLDEY